MTPRIGRFPAIAALTLAAISGAAGLAHQLLWVRRMVDVLGANAGTFSRVVAAFFLGLSMGAWLASRRPTPRPWRSVAVAEGAVALLALVVLGAGQWAYLGQSNPAAARVLAWVLPLLLVTPPALAMGLVIPWMIRAVGAGRATALYAVNTLGGIAGLALVLAWGLPALGLAGASLMVLSLNVAVALAAWQMDRRSPGPLVFAQTAPPLNGGNRSLFATAFASGFLVLGSEVIFQHQLAQFLISSHLASALVLTLVLLALGLGALAAPWLGRLGPAGLTISLTLAPLACAAQPLCLVVQRGGISYLPYKQELLPYLLDAFKLGLPGVALLLLPAALVFPLLLQRAGEQCIDAGKLLAFNGLGGWLGAELTERVLAPTFGLWYSMAVFAAGYALCLFWQRGVLRWALLPLLAASIALAWKIDARLPYAGLVKGDRLVSVAVGREGVVAVVRGEPDDWRILVNNTYTLGGSRSQINQEREALLPMLLHGDARRVATLGVATGSTLSGATLDPAMEHAEGIDLSPLVLRAARESFSPYNRHMADDPRVTLTVGDARWVIGQRPGAFDVIVGDLFLPWNAGEGRLFTREHFAGVRTALHAGGLFCQWLPMYQITQPQFEAILRTFRAVFPDAWLVRGDFYANMPIIGLIGGRSLSSIDWEKTAAACTRVRAAGCLDPLLRHAEGAAMCVVGPPPASTTGPVITLANGWLEWNAARNVIGLREPWLNGVPLGRCLREASRASAGELPESLRAAQNCGDLCLALEIARSAHLPQADGVEVTLRRDFPAALREDPAADWKAWPMIHRPVFFQHFPKSDASDSP